jgi:hypothetical protein
MTLTPDYYSQCEDAIGRLFRTLTDYIQHDWQVSDDDTNLSKGADYFIFFNPGMFTPVPVSEDADRVEYYNWEVLFEIRVRFASFGVSKKKFKAFRSELFNVINAHKRLDFPKPAIANGVLKTTLSSTAKPMYWADKAGQPAPSWIVQQMKATVLQVVPIGK